MHCLLFMMNLSIPITLFDFPSIKRYIDFTDLTLFLVIILLVLCMIIEYQLRK